MARKKFYFDTQTYSYCPVQTDWKKYLIQIGLCLVLAFVCSVVAYDYGAQFEASALIRYNEQLSGQIAAKTVKLQKIEKSLDKIHHNDQTFYKSILNLKPIDQSVWEGGTGGTVPFASAKPKPLQKLDQQKEKLKFKFNLQESSFSELQKIAVHKSDELTHIPAISPINGRIVSGFGYRADPFHGHAHFHAGIDIVAAMGTPIRCVADGVVRVSGTPEYGYGLQIEIDHGYGYVTKYAHLSSMLVSPGQKVKRGQTIALSGNSGYSTGPHLHYEVIKNGTKVDPSAYIYQ
jgi:murein DD-endopeptidase MepM/ murein hydrolase activator NlpD